jgi:hypothetical protein
MRLLFLLLFFPSLLPAQRADAGNSAPLLPAYAVDTDSAASRAVSLRNAAAVAGLGAGFTLATAPLKGERVFARDKLLHVSVAFAGTGVLVHLGMEPLVAGLTMCFASVGWEVANTGPVSHLDIGVSCVGAAIATGLLSLRNTRRR